MDDLDPRIQAALVSVNPTTKNPAWHGAPTAQGVLRGIKPNVAVWRPYSGANNIREIALHLAFYENSIANRLIGESHSLGFKQRKSGWALMLENISESEWKMELDLVKFAHERLTNALTHFNPDLFYQPLGKNSTRNAIEFIQGVAEHSLYHTAQIEMLKSLAEQTQKTKVDQVI